MQLNLSSIDYSYPGGSETVLTAVSATFPTGWTGLIGPNGCGKTTLALIAAGLLTPDSGAVAPTLFSAYCPQDSSIAPANLSDFALDWSSTAVRIRTLLHIEDEWLWDHEQLSGGQQKRVQIACALATEPDLLIMDEPTNDLDGPTRAIVAEALAFFEGVGILISHDRELLDGLVQRCLVFEDGRTVMRPGSYSKASAQASVEREARLRARDAAKREAKRLHAESQRRSEEAARSKGRLSARDLDKHDSDARERIGRAKVTAKDSIAGRASTTMARRAAKAKDDAAALTVSKRYDPTMVAHGQASRGKSVLHIEETVLRTGDFELAVPELWVGPTDHIGIAGPNGTGKSTLVKHLLASVGPSIRTAYLPQSVSADAREKALATLRDLDAETAGRALALVARLNSDPDRLLDGSDTSPGEMRKLMLAEQLLSEPHLLVLDEPTNHLDIGSIEALQAMLLRFSGALILVTHDRPLLEATCPTRWTLPFEAAMF